MSQLWANLGTGGTALDARNGSGTGVDSNDAKLLTHDGTNYVYLPGVASNFMSVPDEAALDITGDIDIRVRVAMDAWTPSATSTLVSKWTGAAAGNSFYLNVTTTGALLLSWTQADTTLRSATSTVTVPTESGVADGNALWIRATLDVDNGGQSRVQFFYAADAPTVPSSWSQIGANVDGTTGVTNIVSGGGNVEMGTRGSGTLNPAAAKVYRAQVLNGIGGTTVLDVDTSVITSGAATSFAATTGQTVTISRSTSGRKSVAVVNDVWLLGTANYLEVPDSDLLDFGASDSFTVMAVSRVWNNAAATSPFIGKASSAGGAGWSLSLNSGSITPRVTGSDGANSIPLTLGPSMVAGQLSTAVATIDRAGNAATVWRNAVAGTSTSTAAVGSLANALPVRVGAYSAATLFGQDMELMAVAVFRRALSASEIAALSTYYATRFP